jgi:hypothetical protein
MRELTMDELDQVSGAGAIASALCAEGANIATNLGNACSNVNANLANVCTNAGNLAAFLHAL